MADLPKSSEPALPGSHAFAVRAGDARLVGERREGTGTPLTLIHGFGGSKADWTPVAEALPADLPLIAYDQRRFGQSTAPADTPYSHADDLLALIDALELDRVDLCGISLGGATALHFALDHPERVRRLVLVSPLTVGWSWSEDWIARWKEIGRAARAGDMATARRLWWEHPLFATARAAPLAAHLKRSIDAFPGQQWIADPARPELPEVERLHELSAPTLLLTGARDLEDFRLIAALIEGAASHVQRIDWPDAGHLLTLERPSRIAAAIARFLA